MTAKVILAVWACALFECALSQCLGREPIIAPGLGSPFGWPYDGFGSFDGIGLGPAWPAAGSGLGSIAPPSGLAASYGGGLAVTSSSPIAPTGLTVNSENTIEGTVTVVGQLPFLGAVATDGAFTTAGAGLVSYGCGDGSIGIVAETPITPIGATGPAVGYGAGLGYGVPGRVGLGCGVY